MPTTDINNSGLPMNSAEDSLKPNFAPANDQQGCPGHPTVTEGIDCLQQTFHERGTKPEWTERTTTSVEPLSGRPLTTTTKVIEATLTGLPLTPKAHEQLVHNLTNSLVARTSMSWNNAYGAASRSFAKAVSSCYDVGLETLRSNSQGPHLVFALRLKDVLPVVSFPKGQLDHVEDPGSSQVVDKGKGRAAESPYEWRDDIGSRREQIAGMSSTYTGYDEEGKRQILGIRPVDTFGQGDYLRSSAGQGMPSMVPQTLS